MKATLTLVIVSSEDTARFLVNTGVGQGLHEIRFLKELQTREYTDAPGRMQAAPDAARHGFNSTAETNDQSRARFAAFLLSEAKQMWDSKGFDRIILAAPPKMLGTLRAMMGLPLSEACAGDLAKDLTSVAASDLPDRFAGIAAF